jgi:hypothetical protein
VLIDEVKDGKTLLHIDIEFKSETETLDIAATKISVTCVLSKRSESTADEVFDVDELEEETVAFVEFDVFKLNPLRLVLSKLTVRRASCELPLNNLFMIFEPGSNETILFNSLSIFACSATAIWVGSV